MQQLCDVTSIGVVGMNEWINNTVKCLEINQLNRLRRKKATVNSKTERFNIIDSAVIISCVSKAEGL